MERGFVLTPDSSGRLDFDLRTEWTPRVHEAFLRSGADGLIANYARGFVGRDLAFIRALPLRRLTVLARTIADLSPIYDVAGSLDELHIQTGSMTRIDLAALPGLRALSCEWEQVAATISDTSTIEDLSLGAYDPADLAPLSHLTSLRSLRMKGRPAVRSLDGVEAMPWLAYLGVYLAPLEDTSALARLGTPVLTELHLAACRRVTSLEDLRHLVGLRFLDVSEGGRIDSLEPIAGLRELHRLYLYDSTTIADGDLTPLLGLAHLRDLRIMNRRHYVPSVQDVKHQLGLVE